VADLSLDKAMLQDMFLQKSFEALTQARAGSRLDQAVWHQSAQGLQSLETE
jgi:hypothetical protein